MKNSILLITSFFLLVASIAQPPQAFKYQAVVRNASGEIISNESIDVRISIIDGWAVGPVIYQETHSTTTNQFGLINLSIGWGIPGTGYNFLNIDWSLNEKFIEVEIWDDVGGTYISMGTSMLFSVPYALYSGDDGDWTRDGNDILAANSGNVGIGTSYPIYKLDVLSSDNTAIRAESTLSYGVSGATSGNNAAGIIGIGQTINSLGVYGHCPSGGIAIQGYSPGWAGYFIGDLYASGNVGFGTTTPNAKLHVNDRIRIGEDPIYASVYGELIHEGSNTGFRLNANSGGSWAYMLFQTDGNTRMAIKHDGRVGINTTSPIGRLHVYSEDSEPAINALNLSGHGITTSSINNYGIFSQSTYSYAGYFSGPVHVTGSLSKGSGSFVIDHPLDPENKLLRHNFVESPENLLIYRGKAELNSRGEAVVEMPDYFKALTKEDEASIHLTPVGRPFITGAEWNKDFSAIIIYGENNRAVFWEVLADRDDPVIHELGRPVEEEKGGDNTLCEKGKLLYPEAFGYPESMGRDYEMKQANKQ